MSPQTAIPSEQSPEQTPERTPEQVPHDPLLAPAPFRESKAIALPAEIPNADDSADSEIEPPKKGFKFGWWMLPILGLLLAIGGLSVYRLQSKNTEEAAIAEQAPLTVRTVAAEEGSIQAWVSSEGTVQAVRFKHLAFDVDGDITYVVDRDGRNLREGDAVSQGELLAQIDDRDLQANLNQAEASVNEAMRQRGAQAASVAQAESQVAQARASVSQAEAQLGQARSARNLAQTELQRYQTLYGQGAISASDLDNRRNTVTDADAQIQVAQGQVSSARAQVDTAQAQVSAAQQQLSAVDSQIATARSRVAQAEVALEGTRLYAPFDGIVAYFNIRENEYYSVQAVSSQTGNYQELLNRVPIVVIDPNQFEVTADLSTSAGNRVRPGQNTLVTSGVAEVADRGDRGNSLSDRAQARGEVYAVNPAVSPGNRSIQMVSRITSGVANLQHGGSVTLWIAADEKDDAVVAPLNAVVFRNQQPYVFVVDEETGTVEQRQVELGVEGLDQREILSGVEPGEQLVTEGQNGLVDGAKVKISSSEFLSSSVSPSSVSRSAEGN